MRIEEEYVKSGYFWLPERKDRKIPGTLTISDGGDIELEVVGLFNENVESINDVDDLSRINGHIEKDGLVTLDSCFYTKKNISFGGISKSKVCVNRVLSGMAYEKDEYFTFNSFSFSVDCFDEWVGVTGIHVDNDWTNEIATITYKPQKNITHHLDNGMQLEICFEYTPPNSSKKTEAKITQRAYFKLLSEELRPLDDFIEVAFKLTNLMCFAVDDTVTIKNLIANSSEIQRELSEGGSYLVPIHIYYKSIPFSEKEPNKSWHQMLFSYGTIKNNAQNVFNSWINAYEIIAPALNLYFSTKSGAQKYLDGKFLALAQGLETYHRRTSDEKLMDTSEFESLVSKISENCPEKYLEWLNGRLMYGNEINLGKRLNRIIEPFKDRLGDKKQRNKLMRLIVDTRNYLTHYNEELKSRAAQGRELWFLCQKMEVIFQLHFLKVIGLTDEEIVSIVESSYPLKRKLNEI
ncbi:HEPN domain-containing protein [Methylophaga nitratireducenticrescens]|uniref:ApeA N-terminal domain 1-containing protein n=1 Tax=Methylophaga nitratireducenticrescens TaxID=754476 RepID=UPI000CDBDFBE|nr:HEPN domain-containing protein [Methylophaga nitratireducenticrescens]AUZ84770.1 hypothetical protein CDW43_09365 [Methylophaga nitratireducenticrescens]